MAIRSTATVDDVLRLGARGERYELIDGALVPMSLTGFEHGGIETHVTWVFYSFVLPRQLGKVCSGEVLFCLDPESKLARAPDVAFVRRERLRGQDLTGAFTVAPDIAIEIVSPIDSANDIQRKVEDWLTHGAQVVLVSYPETLSLVLWRPGRAMSLRDDEVVDMDDILPGFHCTVRELFPPPQSDLSE